MSAQEEFEKMQKNFLSNNTKSIIEDLQASRLQRAQRNRKKMEALRQKVQEEKCFIVVFDGVSVIESLEERTFRTKEDAACFKAEHPQGKFASVIPVKGK